MTEASSQAITMIITISRDIPMIAASQYAVRSRASSRPTPSASTSTGQNPRSSGAPDSAMAMTPPTKTANGTSAPSAPP